MRKYEAILILAHQMSADRQKELEKKVDSIFSKFDVKIQARHDRGKKELGYPMKKHKEGHVYVYDITMDPSKVDALSRELRLEEELLQVMVTHPPAVAAAAGKSRDEAVSSGR